MLVGGRGGGVVRRVYWALGGGHCPIFAGGVMSVFALSGLWGSLGAVPKVESSARVHALPSEVYPAGKLQ